MYEPKAVDHITTNGKHILIYDYLDYPITIMLANEIVLGINPEADEICFMIPDKNYVYKEITDIFSTKPTLGAIEIFLKAHNLWAVESYKNGENVDKQFIQEKLTDIKLHYLNR
jgi:hypothetical protein